MTLVEGCNIMKCKKCNCELTDCNEIIRNSPRAKQLGLKAEPIDHGYAYMCLNPVCKNYGKLLIRELNLPKSSRHYTIINVENMKNLLLHAVLAIIGGAAYMGIEILWRGHTHWSMGVLGGICFVLIGILDEVYDHPPLLAQMLKGAILVTVLELFTGLIVNCWLGWNVWDYSDMPFNLFGQVCLPFSAAWFLLSAAAVKLENVLHMIAQRSETCLKKLISHMARCKK